MTNTTQDFDPQDGCQWDPLARCTHAHTPGPEYFDAEQYADRKKQATRPHTAPSQPRRGNFASTDADDWDPMAHHTH
ncbi:hypothetical protein AB0N09_28025 [Streptomyces erythrochromogenes]|uniref:hypothetical protein n=1 Tax=Streptomyces erythrochromogenes TaxID=285574 RepID=UPI00343343B9